MLVLKRRVGEAILIGDGVEIEILEISSNRVKIGVRAPKEVSVQRREAELTRLENVAAANSDPRLLLSLFPIPLSADSGSR